MSWYTENGNGVDVILSSRVRLARNVTKTPFSPRLSDEKAKEIIERSASALGDEYTRVDFDSIPALSAAAYVEEHLVSADFLKVKTPHTLFKNEKENVYVMVGEEDHFRIQSIVRGDDIGKAYENALLAEEKLRGEFPFAFDEKLGYLTHCPTNLGTAMRVSHMMFLPALTKFGGIGTVSEKLQKLGFTVRGMYGEGSGAVGCIYQISNSITLGETEADVIDALTKVTGSVAEEERRLRKKLPDLSRDELIDKVSRAYGTLTHSYLLSRKEFLSAWIEVRLGLSLSELCGLDAFIPKTVTYEKLDSLLIEAQPSVLSLSHGGNELSPRERDLYRAGLVKERLS